MRVISVYEIDILNVYLFLYRDFPVQKTECFLLMDFSGENIVSEPKNGRKKTSPKVFLDLSSGVLNRVT